MFGNRRKRTDEDVRRLEQRLRSHVQVLAGLIGPRHLRQPSSLEAAAAYIEQQFGEIGDAVERQRYPVGSVEVANLVVERRGTKRPDQVVILGAHYDTVTGAPGADDNASAVATLIESARLLVPLDTPRTIRFVSFPCEEPPCFAMDEMGSRQYARRCRRRNERIIGMICLEMVGYYTTEPASQRVPDGVPRPYRWVVPRRGDFLASVGNLRSLSLLWGFRRGFKRSSPLPLFSAALPERVHAIRLSDNSSFWDQGYPALMITDTSFFRNPNYHQASDTCDTLDYHRLTLATLGVAGAMAWLGGSRQRMGGML